MGRGQSLVKNTMILAVGNLFTKLITFFLLPLYTAVLSTEEYGIVDLLNTLVSLLLPIVTFQVEQAMFRKLIDIRDNEKDKKRVISTGIFSVAIQCIVYLILFFIISSFIDNNYKIFLATNVVAYIFASLFQQIARGFGDNKSYTISSIFSGIFTIVFNVIFLVAIKLQAYGMLLGTMIGQIACVIYLFFKLKIYKYVSLNSFSKTVLKELWKYSIPLIPNSISWWVFNASDRVIVSAILGLSLNGILSAANKFSSVYIMVYNFFHLSWIESISLHINDNDIEEFFSKMFNTALRFFISMGIGIIAVMPFVYPVMIDAKFGEGYYQVPILMLGSLFNVVIALETAVYVAKKDTKAIGMTSTVSAVINIIVHLILIKFIGLYAASISTLIAYLIMSIYRHMDIKKKYYRIKIDETIILSAIIILSILLPMYYINNKLLCLGGFILAGLYALIINRKSISAILLMTKEKMKK